MRAPVNTEFARVPALLLIAIAAACAPPTVLRTGGPYSDVDGKAPAEGVRYTVARDLVIVDARVVHTTSTKWAKMAADDSTSACKPGETRKSDSTLFTVSTLTTGDPEKAFRLIMAPSRTTKQSLTITTTDAGLLSGINYSASDQTGEIAKGIAQGIGQLAGTVVGAVASVALDAAPGEIPGNARCFAVTRAGKAQAKQLAGVVARRDSIINERRTLALTLNNVQTDKDVVLRLKKDQLVGGLFALFDNQATTIRANMASAANAYAAQQEIGVTVDTSPPRRFVFDVATLMSDASRKASSEWRALADTLRVQVEVADAPASAGTGSAQSDVGADSALCKPTREFGSCARIQYRMPRTRVISVYNVYKGANAAAPADSTRLAERTVVPLVSSADPVMNVALDVKRFGSGTLKLAFGKYGNLTSTEQTAEASGATGAAAFVGALTASRESFQASLEGMGKAQASFLGIRSAARAERISELTHQKTLLETEMQLQGARSSQTLLLQKQQIEAELALLTRQGELAAKTDALAAPNATQAQINEMKAQIELLNTQILLEKTKRELEALTKPPVTP